MKFDLLDADGTWKPISLKEETDRKEILIAILKNLEYLNRRLVDVGVID